MKKTGESLARSYRINVRSAYYHNDGNWYWNLERFPGAYFVLSLIPRRTTKSAYT
jgi:hypothetical protein